MEKNIKFDLIFENKNVLIEGKPFQDFIEELSKEEMERFSRLILKNTLLGCKELGAFAHLLTEHGIEGGPITDEAVENARYFLTRLANVLPALCIFAILFPIKQEDVKHEKH